MSTAAAVVQIKDLVRQRNRELYLDAAITFATGLVFTVIIFGGLYWLAFIWGLGRIRGGEIVFAPKAFWFTMVFFVVSVYSAWRQVDPLAPLEPMSETDELLTKVSLAAGGVMYFSPRHSIAGAATFLIGGPGNILEAIGTIRGRIRMDDQLLIESLALLEKCRKRCPFRAVESARAVFFLRKLELIKVLDDARGKALTVTRKGEALLGRDGVPGAMVAPD